MNPAMLLRLAAPIALINALIYHQAGITPMSPIARPSDPPPPVEVGDGVVDGSFIEPYTNAWTVTQTAPDGTISPAGHWTDQVEIVDEHGREVLRRTQMTYTVDGSLNNTQVHTVDHATMAPIRNHTVAGDRVSHFDYDGAKASGVILQGPHRAAIIVQETLDAPAYDWNIFGTLISAFPLADGYSAQVPYFALAPGEMGPDGPTSVKVERSLIGFTVTGRETISAGATGEVDTWVIEVEPGAMSYTFWLSKAPPYIIRLKLESFRGTMLWEME